MRSFALHEHLGEWVIYLLLFAPIIEDPEMDLKEGDILGKTIRALFQITFVSGRAWPNCEWVNGTRRTYLSVIPSNLSWLIGVCRSNY